MINNLPSPGRRDSRRKLCSCWRRDLHIWDQTAEKSRKKEGEWAGGAKSSRGVTCFGVDGEVGLAVQDAVHHPGAVAVGGVVGVRGRHLGHVGSCGEEEGRHRVQGALWKTQR